MNILVITDNEFLYEGFKDILYKKEWSNKEFVFGYSYTNNKFKQKNNNLQEINLKDKNQVNKIIEKYDIIISLHCKQLFPEKIVKNIDCINIHPGYNPYNRGWYPQVFSIINNKPIGVTIHKIDNKLDHGDIIFQKDIKINSWETSKVVYDKLIKLELNLLDEKLIDILNGNYTLKAPVSEGNVNFKSDFNELKKIDLNRELTFKEAIDKLRALTHGDYDNAYFIDDSGNKVWVKIKLKKDSNN